MKIFFLIFINLFNFKPSSFSRLTGSSDLNFFSSSSLYPSLLPFFNKNFLFYLDYRKPYEIIEWNEINTSFSFKRFLFLSIFQKSLKNYSETEILTGFSKKIKNLGFSISGNYLLLNSILKRKEKIDFDLSNSFIFRNLIFSLSFKHILNSFDSKNYYISLNYSPVERFYIFVSREKEFEKIGLSLLLRPIAIFLSFSENFVNLGFGLIFDDKNFIFSFEDNSYLGISLGTSLEFKR
ncbi:MAG: hypothetical protein ABIN15_07535 [candidate division WOR-3 bacterium]